MNKKSQVEAQFNWMYVLIIGSAIFALLVFFGFRIKSSADIGYCNELSFTLKDSVVNANYQSNYFSTIKIKPNADINYDGLSLFCKGSSGASLDNYIFFSQNKTLYNGNIKDMIIFTLPYEKPFFVSNLVYMIDTDYEFELSSNDYDELINDFLLEKFPEKKDIIKSVFTENSGLNNIPFDYYDPELRLAQVLSSDKVFNENMNKLNTKHSEIANIMLTKCQSINQSYSNIDYTCQLDYEALCNDIGIIITNITRDENVDSISEIINNKNLDLALHTCVYLY